MQRGKPPEWWEKQKGSRGIRRGQWYRLVFQFPIREPRSRPNSRCASYAACTVCSAAITN
ncbi:hypothetical protein EIZ94_19265 [Escherichia coli]|nr:hypothetical protein [Escherichia coli]MQH65048.1 hypothetical protein [Escherichia coli]MQI71766.1 hypothetical protein [Escherichia coli]MQK49774.1 hypothetical protein [Escherichia coli]